MRGRRARGFTLIELMIVVAIVAVLAAIAFTSYQEQVRKSRRAQAKADIAELVQLAERFHTVENTYVGFETKAPFKKSPRESAAPTHYKLNLTESASEFKVEAVPQDQQASDKCGTLSLNSKGVKAPATPAECW